MRDTILIRRFVLALGTIGLCLMSYAVTAAADEPPDGNWPRWRGPHGTGHTSDRNLPTEWDESNVVWQTTLPGEGHSSPVIWGDRIFLTSSTEKGRHRLVLAVDRTTGDILWQKVVWTGNPELTYEMNKWASATCATDGERVIAFFGNGGIHCLDVDGEIIWSRDLGVFEGPWGTAASPIMWKNLVIQNCDADNKASLLAMNKLTGETVWDTPRHVIRGWSTPILINAAGRTELVINGHLGVNAYDPATGRELWSCKGSSGRGTPTITPAGDALIAVNGKAGATYAVRPGGSGDVTETHQVWRIERRGRDLPSPIVVDNYVVIANLRPGTATCYDTTSGKELWAMRTGACSASPIAANGLMYVLNEQGETFVIKPGPRENVVARNRFPHDPSEAFRASLTPSGGRIYCRSNRVLYCLGETVSE